MILCLSNGTTVNNHKGNYIKKEPDTLLLLQLSLGMLYNNNNNIINNHNNNNNNNTINNNNNNNNNPMVQQPNEGKGMRTDC